MRVAHVATMLLASLLCTSAHAADAIDMKAITKVAKSEGPPHVIFESAVEGRLDVSLTCAGKRFALAESIRPGGLYTLSLPGLPDGRSACRGSVVLRTSDGGEGTMPLNIDVAVLVPPKLSVDAADLDLDARTLVLQSDRPLADVSIEVFGLGGASIGGAREAGTGATRHAMSWTSEGEILRIDVTGTDVDGAYAVLTLLPWSYEIPHVDVIFDSNQAEILPTEVHKLEDAYAEVGKTLAKYGDIVDIKLFVAGYTDTVGTREHNLALSRRRAKAIAQWFRTRGFAGVIQYAGYGEAVLAKLTPDGTDEPLNRRALYVLAADRPVSSDTPAGTWTALP